MADGVAIRELRRTFGDLTAVAGVSFEIRAGETFGLLGPNGAGKTTLLSMLATQLSPTSGDAEIFGHNLRADPRAVQRQIGLVPQEIALYPDLTGEENLAFFGRLYGVSGAPLRRRCGELLELVGLVERRRDPVRTYSGGMQRRLNLACGLVHAPALLLLDEPTVGVDPHSRENVFTALREIAEQGTTLVYTTHYMEEAERLCDRIAIMDTGRVIALGTARELLTSAGAGQVLLLRGEGLSKARLAALPGCRGVASQDGGFRVSVDSAARAVGPMLMSLSDDGGSLEALSVRDVDLEHVFLQLTGRGLRD